MAYPIYWVITLISPLFRLGRAQNRLGTDDIAIIKMFGIGSITRIFVTLNKHQIDLERVHFYTLAGNKELCEILKIPNVHFIKENGVFQLMYNTWKTIWVLRKQRLNVIIDYERSSNLLGIFRVLATAFTKVRTLSFHNLEADRFSGPDIRYQLAGRSIEELIELTIPFLPKAESATNLTNPSEADFMPEHNILININASNYLPHRKYPQTRFAEIIKNLLDFDNTLKIYLIGSPQEKAYVESLISKYFSDSHQVINCCGLWSLQQLMEAFDRTHLLITNDSGPMHLAVMKGVQTIAIWGPTTPTTFGYTNYPNVVNIQSGRSCAPCFTYPKSKAAKVCNGRIDCMNDIQPVQVIDTAIKLLRQNQVSA